MRRLKSIGFIVAISLLSAFAYGGLYSVSSIFNQDTYLIPSSTPSFRGAVPCSVRNAIAHKHAHTVPFRYYKRYMEKWHWAAPLPDLFTFTFIPYQVDIFRPFAAPATALHKGIFHACTSRGPPCLG
jgi:hypothetical protein